MASRKDKLKGVVRRSNGQILFEGRFCGRKGDGKFCCVVKTEEEAACAYDIMKRYSTLEGKESQSLNYPEYSRFLVLDTWPSEFDIRVKGSKKEGMGIINSRFLVLDTWPSEFDIRVKGSKKEGMGIIMKQARVAAKNLPGNLRRSPPAVGSPSSSLVPAQLLFQGICDISHLCYMAYGEKLIENNDLEEEVAGITGISTCISLQPLRSNKFTSSLASLKELAKQVGRAERDFKSEESRCLRLRQLVEDHNLKVIAEGLKDGSEMSGRLRVNECERFPRVREDLAPGAQ